MIGIVRALLFEYERGSVKTLDEEVRGAVAGDYLEAARSLVDELKDAAALLASGVLEQQIREIAAKYNVPIRENDKPRKTEIINQDLTKAGAYPLDIQKQITAHLGLRNHAAHGLWKEYDAAQVKLMIDWISFFVQKYPA